MTDDRRGIIDRSVPEALEEETDGNPSVKQMMIENQDIPAERAGCPDFFIWRGNFFEIPCERKTLREDAHAAADGGISTDER
ncbi:hypothetical protein ACTQ56_11875 [[Clostridium] aminophilum]|uniref:hypothetical protein n=1 Tax=[Clostridium] aminophilum TaxID=1526 RepID=UPI0026EF6CBB|nr:hypothetical protein [[Clostridium] aminophilum]MDD6195866.1 hypothetical protein [[Clostridium] aminophilum]